MSKYDDDYFEDRKFGPETEEDGGIQRTSAENDELKHLEDLYNSPAATTADRTTNQPKTKNITDGIKTTWVGRKFRAKSSVITLAMLLFGSGGFLTVFFTPSLALNQLTTMMTQSLNDQFHAVSERSDMLLQAKLSDVTKGSCGLVKIGCRFASMSDSQAERFKKAGIEVERKQGFLLKNRGQITQMTFTAADGKKVSIKSAEELHRLSLENIEFAAAKTKAYNPMFATLTDKVVTNVLNRLKARKMPVSGETDEERRKNLNSAIGGETAGNGRPLVETDDKDKGTKYSVDGEDISKEQADGAKGLSTTIKNIREGGGFQSVAKGVLHGVGALGYLQTACSVYTLADVTSGIVQVEKGAQAVRFAMTGPLSTESAMRAGEATEGTVNFIANNGSTPMPAENVADESKFGQQLNGESVPTTTNPYAGTTMFDAKGYKYAAYHEAPETVSLQESRFMLGGGTPSALDTTLSGVAGAVSPDNPTPQGVRQKCRIINHPLVTIASLGVGIVLGAGSFGLTTVAGIAGSVAVSMAAPYFMGQIADTLSAETFKDLIGKDFGEGTYVGTAFFLSSIAKARGGKPLNKTEGKAYLEKNLASTAAYEDTQRYIARAAPLDPTNRYSFLGSIVFGMIPAVEKSKTSASMAMMNMANILPTAFKTLSPTASAAAFTVPDNYLSCNDQRMIGAGVNGDFMCVAHYGETESGMKKRPVETANYMAQTGNIDPESETGNAKDNGQAWNYVKFLDECVNRTLGWGIANDNDQADGTNCTKTENESQNEYFRAFTMYKTINESMDTSPQPMTTGGTEAYTDGQAGTVTDGWSFPTKDDAVISEGFGSGTGREKNGMTVTASNPSDTNGMPLFAVYEGTVVAAGNDAILGNRIILNHWINGQLISTVYGHLGKNSIASGLKPGDSVKGGQQIGVITAEDGQENAKLYFEMWEGPTTTGQPIDPMRTLGVTRKAKEATNA